MSFLSNAFHTMTHAVAHAAGEIGKDALRDVKKAAIAVATSPLTKIAGVGLSFVVPPAGAAMLAATGAADKLITLAQQASAAGRAAAKVIENTHLAASHGHADAKRAALVLEHVRAEQIHKGPLGAYHGTFVMFSTDRQKNARQGTGAFFRATPGEHGSAVGTLVTPGGMKFHGWWKRA